MVDIPVLEHLGRVAAGDGASWNVPHHDPPAWMVAPSPIVTPPRSGRSCRTRRCRQCGYQTVCTRERTRSRSHCRSRATGSTTRTPAPSGSCRQPSRSRPSHGVQPLKLTLSPNTVFPFKDVGPFTEWSAPTDRAIRRTRAAYHNLRYLTKVRVGTLRSESGQLPRIPSLSPASVRSPR